MNEHATNPNNNPVPNDPFLAAAYNYGCAIAKGDIMPGPVPEGERSDETATVLFTHNPDGYHTVTYQYTGTDGKRHVMSFVHEEANGRLVIAWGTIAGVYPYPDNSSGNVIYVVPMQGGITFNADHTDRLPKYQEGMMHRIISDIPGEPNSIYTHHLIVLTDDALEALADAQIDEGVTNRIRSGVAHGQEMARMLGDALPTCDGTEGAIARYCADFMSHLAENLSTSLGELAASAGMPSLSNWRSNNGQQASGEN